MTYDPILGTFEVGISNKFTNGIEDLLELLVSRKNTAYMHHCQRDRK